LPNRTRDERSAREDFVLAERRALINDALRRNIETVDELPDVARQALRSATASGKRIRPTITLLACQSVGGQPQNALDTAVAIELIHCASLIVDDVIDESELRRGQATIRARFGTDLAVMVSMVLTTRALRLVVHNDQIIASLVEAVDDLSVGECMDIRAGKVDLDRYISMTSKKTGALFRVAAESGALLGGADSEQRSALRAFGQNLGIAFQIRDDVLDATGDEDTLGKPVGSDLLLGRPSMVSVLLSEKLDVALPELAAALAKPTTDGASDSVRDAVDDAMRACRAYVDRAASALDAIPDSAPRRHLAGLLHYAVDRWE
jgi:geranylgeranyl diphosphate synthase, type I